MVDSEGKIVVGVDLDGVCADYYGRMREIAAEWLEKSISDLTTEFTWGLREWGLKDGQYDTLHRFAVTQRGLFKTQKVIPGARRILRALSDEGYRIRIITHRLFIRHFHEKAVVQTMEWLDQNDIPFWDLCFMRDKDQVGADVYIEDSPRTVEELRRRGHRVICFANSTNHGIEPPRVTSWDDVYRLIKEEHPIS